MDLFGPVDWTAVFVPKVPILETFVRGTVVYLTLFLLFRVVLKRQAGAVSVTDLLLVVLIADASQNAMAGDYKSTPDGLLLAATLIFWDYALDWLGYRVPALGRMIHPPPLPIVENGQMNRKNMRRELISVQELMSQLREQGVDDIQKVKNAYMEGDGRISVIPEDGKTNPPDKRPAI